MDTHKNRESVVDTHEDRVSVVDTHEDRESVVDTHENRECLVDTHEDIDSVMDTHENRERLSENNTGNSKTTSDNESSKQVTDTSIFVDEGIKDHEEEQRIHRENQLSDRGHSEAESSGSLCPKVVRLPRENPINDRSEVTAGGVSLQVATDTSELTEHIAIDQQIAIYRQIPPIDPDNNNDDTSSNATSSKKATDTSGTDEGAITEVKEEQIGYDASPSTSSNLPENNPPGTQTSTFVEGNNEVEIKKEIYSEESPSQDSRVANDNYTIGDLLSRKFLGHASDTSSAENTGPDLNDNSVRIPQPVVPIKVEKFGTRWSLRIKPKAKTTWDVIKKSSSKGKVKRKEKQLQNDTSVNTLDKNNKSKSSARATGKVVDTSATSCRNSKDKVSRKEKKLQKDASVKKKNQHKSTVKATGEVAAEKPGSSSRSNKDKVQRKDKMVQKDNTCTKLNKGNQNMPRAQTSLGVVEKRGSKDNVPRKEKQVPKDTSATNLNQSNQNKPSTMTAKEVAEKPVNISRGSKDKDLRGKKQVPNTSERDLSKSTPKLTVSLTKLDRLWSINLKPVEKDDGGCHGDKNNNGKGDVQHTEHRETQENDAQDSRVSLGRFATRWSLRKRNDSGNGKKQASVEAIDDDDERDIADEEDHSSDESYKIDDDSESEENASSGDEMPKLVANNEKIVVKVKSENESEDEALSDYTNEVRSSSSSTTLKNPAENHDSIMHGTNGNQRDKTPALTPQQQSHKSFSQTKNNLKDEYYKKIARNLANEPEANKYRTNMRRLTKEELLELEKKRKTKKYLHNVPCFKTKRRKYSCSICGKHFAFDKYLKSHVKRHSLPKKYECKVCGKCFQYKSKLRDHMNRHKGKLPYRCRICGKGFPDTRNIKAHERYHTGEKPYKCEYCDKRFRLQGMLVGHRRYHTGERPYVCHCGEAFHSSGHLSRHKKGHTGENKNVPSKPAGPRPRVHPCEYCGKKFESPSSVAKHRRTHTKERPFACAICGKRFVHKSHRSRHEKTVHIGLRPFKCSRCGNGFPDSSNLKIHEEHVHAFDDASSDEAISSDEDGTSKAPKQQKTGSRKTIAPVKSSTQPVSKN
ncbi:uncharacterized protein [Amphiura filiformis]|uniref:uncharacterized protein n=1 Tax=Amphiura filiformis TaxID=82378 RepID=UPI003B20C874